MRPAPPLILPYCCTQTPFVSSISTPAHQCFAVELLVPTVHRPSRAGCHIPLLAPLPDHSPDNLRENHLGRLCNTSKWYIRQQYLSHSLTLSLSLSHSHSLSFSLSFSLSLSLSLTHTLSSLLSLSLSRLYCSLQTVGPYQRFASLWQYTPPVYSQTIIRPFRR